MDITTTEVKAMLSRIKDTKFKEVVEFSEVLSAYRFNNTRVAKVLGVSRHTIIALIKNDENPDARVYRDKETGEIIKLKLHKEMGEK